MAAVRSIDLAPALAAMAGCELIVAADVDSPLAGVHGAAVVFGPQKGADGQQIRELDAGLGVLGQMLGLAPDLPGAGAGGGLGAALAALGAQIVPGSTLISQVTGLDDALRCASLALTGEGRVDLSTTMGKTPTELLRASRRAGIPAVVLGGAIRPGAETLYDDGLAGMFAIGSEPRTLEEALSCTSADLRSAARATCSVVSAARHCVAR